MEGVGRSTLVAAVLAVAAVVLLAVVAAGGPVPLATEGAREPTEEGLSTRVVDAERSRPAGRPGASPASSATGGSDLVSVVVQAVLILGFAVLATLVVQALVRRQRHEPVLRNEPPEEHWPRPSPTAMADAVDEGLAALRSGPADEVIVACWVRLEDAAAGAGVARGVGETPAELAGRVLADLHAPSRAVDELLTRYRLARYSHHPLDEDDRIVAIRSLEQVRQAIAGPPV